MWTTWAVPWCCMHKPVIQGAWIRIWYALHHGKGNAIVFLNPHQYANRSATHYNFIDKKDHRAFFWPLPRATSYTNDMPPRYKYHLLPNLYFALPTGRFCTGMTNAIQAGAIDWVPLHSGGNTR